MGLWATITSCESDLVNTNFKYNYVIVVNGEEHKDPDTQNVIDQLTLAGKLKQFVKVTECLSPPQARERGVSEADGKYLFFFDNHCLVAKDYFKRALLDFEKYDIDVLHSTTQYYAGMDKCFHYKLKLAYNFWAEAAPLPQVAHKPYRIAAGGHGGFAVKADVWREVGGYGPSNLFLGYGGEELYFDLKCWMLGKSVWLDPYLLHYHYAGKRGYRRHYTDEFYVNMLACANVIGGRKWMYKVFESFSTPERFISYKGSKHIYDCLMEAEGRSNEHAAELAGKVQRTLDEQLVWFQQNDIPTK